MTWGAVELEPEVQRWLEDLPSAQFGRAAFYIEMLADQGPQLGEPWTQQLDGSRRELRFYLDRQLIGITYRMAADRRSILLTAITEDAQTRQAEGRPSTPSVGTVYQRGALRSDVGDE